MKRVAGILLLALAVCGFWASGAQATPSRGANCASCHMIASAGSDRTVDAGADVTLDGSGSRYDESTNTINSYAWTQTGGTPTVSLAGANTSRATFIAPTVSTQTRLTFRLAVTDVVANVTTTKTDTCVITVNASSGTANRAPTANAGADKSATSGSTVTLAGTGSDPDTGDTITYTWSQIGTPAVSLANANSASASFTAPTVQTATVLTFQLLVQDRARASATDTCSVMVSPSGGGGQTTTTLPVADAGLDQNVLPGTLNTLSGFYSSDSDGSIVSYAWTQTNGPAVTLSDPATMTPVFQAPTAPSTLAFRLVVTDDRGLQDSDTVTVVVLSPDGGGTQPPPPSSGNQPPVARAGQDLSARSGSTVRLTGSGSTDPDGSIASYQWRQVSGTSVRLSRSTSANVSFTAPRVSSRGASLVFELTVRDGAGLSSSDTVTVNVSRSGGDDDDDDDDD